MIKEYPIAREVVPRSPGEGVGYYVQVAENPRAINLKYVTSVRQYYPNSLLVSLVGEASAFPLIADYESFVIDWRNALR